MIDAEQIRRFCSALFGGFDGNGDERLAGLSVTAAWTLPDRRTRWAPADDAGAIVSAMIEAAKQQSTTGGPHSIFFGAGLTSEPKGAKRRAEEDDVVALVAISADVDVLGPGHKAKTYPPTFEAARALVESMGLPPTMIVDSGGGLHAWWVFAEPQVWLEDGELDTEARAEVARLLKDWNSTLRYRADRAGGWKIDSTFELSRLMRVPGTINLKDHDNPLPVCIVHFDETARYEIDDFAAHLADRDILDTYTAGFSAESKVAVLEGVNLHELWARVTSADYHGCGYTPEWLADLLELDASGKLSQTWNDQRPGFSGSELDAALVRLLYDLGASTEMQVEAIMCRRLRIGEKIEKVDPHRRVDYLARTLANIQALASKSKAARERMDAAQRAASQGRISAASNTERRPEDRDEPMPDEEADGDPFADHIADWMNYEPSEHADQLPRRETEAAREQIEAEHQTPGHRRERPVHEPGPPSPEPEIEAEDPAWGSRSESMVTVMAMLDDLLIPQDFRDRGFSVWRLERRDHGEAQRGRLVVKVPHDFDWPSGDRPDMYKPGRPLFTEWYKRSDFHTPRGFRIALQQDVMIGAQEVGNKVNDWNQLINLLSSYWSRDSSGSDLKSAAVEWLLSYLLDHPPITDKEEAGQRTMPYLVDHRSWGAEGAPVVWFPMTAYLASVATRPGGIKGRDAKRLLDYLDIRLRRPRMVGKEGQVIRLSWQEIQPEQFTSADWSAILEAAYDANLARQGKPHLEAVREDRERSRPSFRVRRVAGGDP